jgi:hypothetical protein
MPWGGQGVFAGRPFRRGEAVLMFGGPKVRRSAIADFTHYLEVGHGWFLGPSGGLDDLVNHGCRPNTAVEPSARAVLLRAIRHIRINEEIRFDYSTVMVTDPTSFECRCGYRHCRRVIGAWHALPRRKRDAYIRRGLVPAFTIAAAERLSRRSKPSCSSRVPT